MRNRPDDLWQEWLLRWDRFQERYVPYREQQFNVILDYATELKQQAAPLRALDVCSGPGSLATRLLVRQPRAEVVAVDIDPWLIDLGRRAGDPSGRVRWVNADLRERGWTESLREQVFDVAFMVTALHWFEDDEVRGLYQDIAGLLRPGGFFLAADIVPSGTGLVCALSSHLLERDLAAAGGDDWPAFWLAARGEPAFGELLAERDRRLGPRRPHVAPPLAFHEDALLHAGFRDAGEVWRYHASAILLAAR